MSSIRWSATAKNGLPPRSGTSTTSQLPYTLDRELYYDSNEISCRTRGLGISKLLSWVDAVVVSLGGLQISEAGGAGGAHTILVAV